MFNSGSFLGIALVSQVVSGLLLVLYYNTGDSYGTVVFIVIEVHGGWLVKLFHRNNARVIFLTLYLHLYKNLHYFSYRLTGTWSTGVLMMVLIIGAAFSGYVLVGSQISY